MEIKEQVYSIIRKNLSVIYENSEITNSMDLIRDLGFDSITIIQLILDIEDAFSIEFDEGVEFDDIVVVGNLIEYILKKSSETNQTEIK